MAGWMHKTQISYFKCQKHVLHLLSTCTLNTFPVFLMFLLLHNGHKSPALVEWIKSWCFMFFFSVLRLSYVVVDSVALLLLQCGVKHVCWWSLVNIDCRMTNYQLLRWLVETLSRDIHHYRMLDASRSTVQYCKCWWALTCWVLQQ